LSIAASYHAGQRIFTGRLDTGVREWRRSAILAAMNAESDRIPAKPTLDGLEDKWAQRWSQERVVQV
jgi:hypothetical protein